VLVDPGLWRSPEGEAVEAGPREATDAPNPVIAMAAVAITAASRNAFRRRAGGIGGTEPSTPGPGSIGDSADGFEVIVARHCIVASADRRDSRCEEAN
jgi:hypothetical protein